jgi:hypothetical protein
MSAPDLRPVMTLSAISRRLDVSSFLRRPPIRPAAHAPADALAEPLAAFPSWFMRVTCERCGHERMFNEVNSARRGMPIRKILDRMRHDGCGGRAGKAELLTGIEGVSSRPVRRIILRGEP